MKNQRLTERLVYGSIGLLFTVLAGHATCTIKDDNIIKAAAERARAAIYEPVGNGGALSEMHGIISPSRQKMYLAMDKVYCGAKLASSDGVHPIIYQHRCDWVLAMRRKFSNL